MSKVVAVDVETLVPTVVKYDVMREAANRLRGRLVALEDARPDEATHFQQQRIDVSRRARAVDAQDRAAIAKADAVFRAELAHLPML